MLPVHSINPWIVNHKDALTLIIAWLSACVALTVYWKNAETKRAEFIRDLHKSFFEESKYDKVRKKLDYVTEGERVAIVLEESEETTRFLNFFELVAYFEKRGIIKFKDVTALLGYYLKLLNTDGIRGYLRTKDYEELDRLLGMMKTK